MGCVGGKIEGERTSPWRHARPKYVLTTDNRYAWQPVELQPARNETHKRICDSLTHTNVLYTVGYSIIRLVYVMETVAIYCLEETEFSYKLFEIWNSGGQSGIDAIRSALLYIEEI